MINPAAADRRASAPGEGRKSRFFGCRMRRGSNLVEYGIIATLYFTFLFGIIEFSWISNDRSALLLGCYRASRTAAAGSTVDTIKSTLRSSSQISVGDSYIEMKYCDNELGTGTWTNDVADDATTGNPPTANNVPTGRPIRISVKSYPHRLLAGSMFNWLGTQSGGYLPLSASIICRRE